MLESCLDEVLAWERLQDPEVGGQATAEQLYELCKAAGFPEWAAQKAGTKRAWERMQQELPL